MRALVTGGAGFIGSTLVDRLLAEGHAVDVIDDLSTGSLTNLADARSGPGRDFTFHQIDVRSPDIAGLIGRRRPDVVYHLATRADGPGPVADAEVTVLGSLQILEGARAASVPKVVFASSRAIYGEAKAGALPIKESHPQHPRTPRGVAERAVGEYLVVYRERHEVEFTALVLADVYGPRQDPRRHTGTPAAMAARLLAGEPGTIHGDGTRTCDLVFVDDVVDAFARAATRGSGLLMNIGTGVETTAAALHQAVADAIGADLPPARVPALPGEPLRTSLDASRAAIHLGWKPWTSPRDGVASTVEWLRSSRR